MTKRPYTLEELGAALAGMDPTATATGLVAQTASLADTHALNSTLAALNDGVQQLSAEVASIKRTRYGSTFVCSSCKKDQTLDRMMNGHRTMQWDSHEGKCPVTMCYDCSKLSNSECPMCKQCIWHWDGGPTPYVEVNLYAGSVYYSYRLELDFTKTTLGEVKDIMLPKIPADCKLESISVFEVLPDTRYAEFMDCTHLMNKKLCEFKKVKKDRLVISVNVK